MEVALSVGKGINKDFGLLRSAAKELDYTDIGGVKKPSVLINLTGEAGELDQSCVLQEAASLEDCGFIFPCLLIEAV